MFDPRGVSPFHLWRLAHEVLELTAIRQAGLISGARFGRVALEAYQIAPALRLLAKPSPRLLIADDVGLGKTIEAGLSILELLARRRADRILIVVPPGLLLQWKDELLTKFGLEFTLIGNAGDLSREQTMIPAGLSPWDILPLILTSMDYLKKETVRKRALKKKWDLVIVDEAHYMSESGSSRNPYPTQRTRLGRDLRDNSRGLLLLTATPHNGYSHSFRSLIELVEPTAATFHGDEARRQDRIERSRIRRMKSQIIRATAPGKWEQAFLVRNVEGIPVLTGDDETALFKQVSTYCSRTVKDALNTDDKDLVGFAMQIVKKRMLSSRAALIKTIENRLSALKKEEAREEQPLRSEIRELQADLPMSELTAERIAQRIVKSAIPKEEKRRKSEITKLNTIRKMLKKLAAGDSKIKELMAHLREVFGADRPAKVIVFTEYLDTLESIKEALDASDDLKKSYVILRGGLTIYQRRRVEERFADPGVRILLATDAASEGLNLHYHCHRVIHFELPWNPNRMEQRNGRVDRYGQTRKPEIRYLYYPRSPEDDILHQLVRKIEEMQSDRISTPDILGILAGASEIETGLITYDAETDPDQRKASLVKLFEDRTQDFIKNVSPLLLSGKDVAGEIREVHDRLSSADPLLGDDTDLERLILDHLGLNCMKPTDLEHIYRIEVPRPLRGPGVSDLYPRVTCRRSVAVRMKASEVEFITPLHPLVQTIAANARMRLLQVYPDERGLSPKRLAARRVPKKDPPGILFTFLGEVTGENQVIEEMVIPVRVGLDGKPIGSIVENIGLVHERQAPGEVAPDILTAMFKGRFDGLYEKAREAARKILHDRAGEIKKSRAGEAQVLRDDLAAYQNDRMDEIAEEERVSRGLIEDSGQIRLFEAEPTKGGFEAKRAWIETFAKQREQEIAGFEKVEATHDPRPLGALFLLPEGWEERS